MSYNISRTVGLDFDEAVSRTVEELKKEGFGVLTDIDFKSVLKEKLEVRRHRSGVCDERCGKRGPRGDRSAGPRETLKSHRRSLRHGRDL